MIPEIKASAHGGGGVSSSMEDFTYLGFNWIYSEEDSKNPPFGYTISDDTCNYVFQAFTSDFKTMFASEGMLLEWALSQYCYFIWNTAYADDYEFLGKFYNDATTIYYYLVDDNGSEFQFCFEILGVKVNILLDENGDPIQSSKGRPTANVKNSDSVVSAARKAKQDQVLDTKHLVLPYIGKSESGYPSPYFVGTTLNFFIRTPGATSFDKCTITNCANTQFIFRHTSLNQGFLSLMYLDDYNHNSVLTYADNSSYTFTYYNLLTYVNFRSYLSSSLNGSHSVYANQFYNNYVHWDISLPCFYYREGTLAQVDSQNCLGFSNNTNIVGSADLFLSQLTFTTVQDPTVIYFPIDVDIPVDQIIDFDIELPSEDPDNPVTVDPFIPEPSYPMPWDPIVLPGIPSIVSGNDDLWPDLNGLFDGQANLDQYLSPLSNFSFSSFATLTESFGSAMAWVSTCMMTIYNGSSFSVLFSVLAMLFIACALLGIYKWWTH